MKIELCEDNGCFSDDGVPSIVIVQLTGDDGKVVRVPYKAQRKIADIYRDAVKMMEKAVSRPMFQTAMFPIKVINEAAEVPQKFFDNFLIEREDIVNCIKVIPRDEGVEQDIIPVVGQEYRVLNIVKQNGEIIFYEVLDDKKDNKIRMPVYAEEVSLLRKRIPPPIKVQTFSTIKRCVCGEENAIDLHFDGDRYSGKCVKCGLLIEEKRVMQTRS